MDSGSVTDDRSDCKDFSYNYVNPERLRRHAWLAARRRIMSESDDDEEFNEENCSMDSDSLRSASKASPPSPSPRRTVAAGSRPRTAPCRTRTVPVPSLTGTCPPARPPTEPAAFSRPSRYRTQTTCQPERNCGVRSQYGTRGEGEYYADGSEIRHTVKSRDMSSFGHLKRCVVDQIDFIKQRDGIWSNERLYGAVTILGTFMEEHQFRYIYLPDHQRQWLEDMITRLDQWNNMKLPYTAEYLKHRAYNERRRKYQERVDAECYRLINPQNFEKQEQEKRVAQDLLHREMLLKHRQDQARRQARLDLIEHRTRDPTRRTRMAEQQMPMELRPPRNPRGSRSLSRDVLLPRKPIRLQDPLKIPHRPFKEVSHDIHAAKLFGDGIRGRMQRKRSPIRTRPVSQSPSRSIKYAVARSTEPRPKTAGHVRKPTQSVNECSDVSVAPDDLMELLELIQNIETKQQEINGELELLREEAKGGKRSQKISQAWWEDNTVPDRAGKRTAESVSKTRLEVTEELPVGQSRFWRPKISPLWWEGKPQPVKSKQQAADSLHYFHEDRQLPNGKSCHPKVTEAWWEGKSDSMKRSARASVQSEESVCDGYSVPSVPNKRVSRQLPQPKVWQRPPSPLPRLLKKRTKSVDPPKIPEAWWEGRQSEPVKLVEENKENIGRPQNTEGTDRAVQSVYSDVNSVINDYVNRLVEQEFSLSLA